MSDDYDLKRCMRCGASIPSVATKCAACNSSHVDSPPPAGAGRKVRVGNGWSVTTVLILANVGFYLWSLYVQKVMTPDRGLLGLVLGGPGERAFSYAGMYRHEWVVNGHWWRLVSATFLHGGLLHIGFNMYALHQLGRLAEGIFGPVRLLVVYLVTGVCSMAAVSIWFAYVPGTPDPVPTVGASGAIFGVAGLVVTFLWTKGTTQGRAIAKSLAINLLLLLVLGFVIKMISNTGHVGGMIPGLLFGLFLAPHFADRLNPGRENLWRIVAAGLAVGCVYALFLAVQNVLQLQSFH